MNWIQENKFLAVLLAVLLAGMAGGGAAIYFAYDEYDQASQDFEKAAGEYTRLRTLKPYPSDKNLSLLRHEKDNFTAKTANLQKSLAGMVIPNEVMKKEEFQDRLHKIVDAVRGKAGRGNPPVVLPDGFYLDFNRYKTELPRDEITAAVLARELKAIEMVVNGLIDSKIDALNAFKRSQLPEESGSAPSQSTAKSGAKAGASPQPLVVKHALDFSFTADQAAFRRVLNNLSSAKKQFLIVRVFQVRNQMEKGPPRGGALPPVPGTPPAPAAPAAGVLPNPYTNIPGTPAVPAHAQPLTPDAVRVAPPAVIAPAVIAPAAPAAPAGTEAPVAEDAAGTQLKYIVGEEKIFVTMRLEIVDFPATPLK